MIRLIISLILFLLSLLVVFKAPTNFLWRVSVAVTEFPYIFFLAALALLLSEYWGDKYKIPVVNICLIACIVFALPIIRTYQRGSNLDKDLSMSFPYKTIATQMQQPFSIWKMFSGIGITPVAYKKINYKAINTENLSLDYYKAETTAKAPCIVVIHGGSWREGDSQQLPALNYYLANRGYNVASISYRLAPKALYPAPIEDTKEALKYLREHAAELNIDTTAFVLLGRSAGGQIALMSAYTLNDPNIKGVISIYAPADMEWGAKIKTNKWVLDTDKVMGDYLGGSVYDIPEKYKACSAPYFVSKNSTPTLMIHGENDAMVSFQHSVRLQKKLNEFQVKNYFLDLPTATHGCDYNINGPSGQITTFTIERFINSVVAK
ncbi:MAG: alpha/beta hydrolase [Bacteroidetes bacterium]|nr:alpha/beta hydrolase [Bacteroidota bacterium]